MPSIIRGLTAALAASAALALPVHAQGTPARVPPTVANQGFPLSIRSIMRSVLAS